MTSCPSFSNHLSKNRFPYLIFNVKKSLLMKNAIGTVFTVCQWHFLSIFIFYENVKNFKNLKKIVFFLSFLNVGC